MDIVERKIASQESSNQHVNQAYGRHLPIADDRQRVGGELYLNPLELPDVDAMLV